MGVPSAVRTSAGTTFAVCASTPTSYDAGGFGSLIYTVVSELVDLGSFGKKYNLVTFMPLGDRKVVKRKGSYNNGTLALKFGSAPTNQGQYTMQGGSNSDLSYSFRVVTQSGSTYYFTGQIMSWILEVGSVDQITGASCDLEIDNDIIPVGLA
jgi:hypothetical protein